jgi:UDP-glucose:(heptosyl)LPS alpha-1,3-glucosyltransferase
VRGQAEVKKKIAVVIPKYGLVGGGEQFALQLTEKIAQNPRYEVHVFANKWNEELSGCLR